MTKTSPNSSKVAQKGPLKVCVKEGLKRNLGTQEIQTAIEFMCGQQKELIETLREKNLNLQLDTYEVKRMKYENAIMKKAFRIQHKKMTTCTKTLKQTEDELEIWKKKYNIEKERLCEALKQTHMLRTQVQIMEDRPKLHQSVFVDCF